MLICSRSTRHHTCTQPHPPRRLDSHLLQKHTSSHMYTNSSSSTFGFNTQHQQIQSYINMAAVTRSQALASDDPVPPSNAQAHPANPVEEAPVSEENGPKGDQSGTLAPSPKIQAPPAVSPQVEPSPAAGQAVQGPTTPPPGPVILKITRPAATTSPAPVAVPTGGSWTQ